MDPESSLDSEDEDKQVKSGHTYEKETSSDEFNEENNLLSKDE